MEGLRQGDLSIDVQETAVPPVVKLVWQGRSAARFPATALGPLFTRVLKRAGAAGAAVEMTFHTLEHFNSATMTSVIELIQDAAAGHIPLVIAYDSAVKWQRISFEALRVFSRDDGLLEIRAT